MRPKTQRGYERSDKGRAVQAAATRRYSLKRNFGLTEAAYDAMLEGQGYVCAICQSPPGKRRLAVDHDHQTGAIRGLLCFKCNMAVGFLSDSPERAAATAAYLKG